MKKLTYRVHIMIVEHSVDILRRELSIGWEEHLALDGSRRVDRVGCDGVVRGAALPTVVHWGAARFRADHVGIRTAMLVHVLSAMLLLLLL